VPGTCVIEINDAGLIVADTTGVRIVSPGYAVLAGRDLIVGEAAYACSRLNPRRSFDRFWEQLDQQPLARSAGPAQSHADLAYFHLHAVWDQCGGDDEALLAVPVTFDKHQLSLVLGIAQACEIPVAGLVAAPVTAAAVVNGSQPRLHLDAQQHRLIATRIEADDGLRLGAVDVVAQRGLSELRDRWAALIAERFVQATRFDPLHQAHTEQLLYDRLPDWLAHLRTQATARLELPGRLRNYHIDVKRAALSDAADGVYQPLAELSAAAGKALVLVSHRLAALPGLVERLTESCAVPPTVLSPEATTRAILAHADAIRSDPVAPFFVTRLPGPIDGAQSPLSSQLLAARTVRPTHLLHRWRAYPIDQVPLVLGASAPRTLHPGETPAATVVVRDGAALLQAGEAADVRLNGQAVNGEAFLAVGDQLCVGEDGEQMRLIVLVDPEQLR
jgi:hypothetical protein